MQFDLRTFADYDSYSPYVMAFKFCMVIILIIIACNMIENIYRFFHTKKRLRAFKSTLDVQAYSSRQGKLFQDILTSFSALQRLKPAMDYCLPYDAIKNHLVDKIQHSFLKGNLFVILSVLSVFWGGLMLIFNLVGIFSAISVSSSCLGSVSPGIEELLTWQRYTLITLTSSVLAHLSSKNMAQSISRETTTLEIRMLENLHEQ